MSNIQSIYASKQNINYNNTYNNTFSNNLILKDLPPLPVSFSPEQEVTKNNVIHALNYLSEIDEPKIIYQIVHSIRKYSEYESDYDRSFLNEVNFLVNFLYQNDINFKVQFEILWILTNISSTEHAQIVVDTGVCSKIVSLMKSPNEDVREQSLWCLGNIVADNNDFLNHVLNIPDSINNLLLNIIYASSIRLRQNALWALNNFCYKINNLDMKTIKSIIPVIARVILTNDIESIRYALSILLNITHKNNDCIEIVLNTGIVDRLIYLTNDCSTSYYKTVIKIIGNFVAGTEKQTQVIVNNGIIDILEKVLDSKDNDLITTGSWNISNLTATENNHIELLMRNEILLDKSMHFLSEQDKPISVKYEVLCTVFNIVVNKNIVYIRQLILYGLIPSIFKIYDDEKETKNINILEQILNIINVLLQNRNQINCVYLEILKEFEENNIYQLLKNISKSKYNNIREKALNILEREFGLD